MTQFVVTGPVAVVRGDNKSERYLYKGAVFSDDGLDVDNVEHLQSVKLIEQVADDGPEFPEGNPSEDWSGKELDAYAAAKGVDVKAAKNKAEKADLLLAAAASA